nr:hypothetical protein [Tanacetum cinerariifolium]
MQPIVDLDGDDDDDVEEKRANTRWTHDEEILLTESWVESSQNAAKPIDEDNLAELFDPDPRARPVGKPRLAKKAKSMDTSSVGGAPGESIEVFNGGYILGL